jgi:hypothetical protein
MAPQSYTDTAPGAPRPRGSGSVADAPGIATGARFAGRYGSVSGPCRGTRDGVMGARHPLRLNRPADSLPGSSEQSGAGRAAERARLPARSGRIDRSYQVGLQPGVDPDDCPPPAVTDTIGGPVAAECARSNPAGLRFSPAAFFWDSDFLGGFSAPGRNLQSPKMQENVMMLLFQPPPGGEPISHNFTWNTYIIHSETDPPSPLPPDPPVSLRDDPPPSHFGTRPMTPKVSAGQLSRLTQYPIDRRSIRAGVLARPSRWCLGRYGSRPKSNRG